MGISLLSRYNFKVPSLHYYGFQCIAMIFSPCLTCLFLVFSYCGAQIFEIYGLGKEVVDLAFCGSRSSIGGATFDEVCKQSNVFVLRRIIFLLCLHTYFIKSLCK